MGLGVGAVMVSSLLAGSTALLPEPRVMMIDHRVCDFTPYFKVSLGLKSPFHNDSVDSVFPQQLTCRCDDRDSFTFLELKLKFFIKEKGQEVRRRMLELLNILFTVGCFVWNKHL